MLSWAATSQSHHRNHIITISRKVRNYDGHAEIVLVDIVLAEIVLPEIVPPEVVLPEIVLEDFRRARRRVRQAAAGAQGIRLEPQGKFSARTSTSAGG